MLALATLVVGAGALAAWGFWSSSGSGAAPAAVGSFAEPGAPTISVTNGTVTLTWSAAAPPGTGAVDYLVERFDEVDLDVGRRLRHDADGADHRDDVRRRPRGRDLLVAGHRLLPHAGRSRAT